VLFRSVKVAVDIAVTLMAAALPLLSSVLFGQIVRTPEQYVEFYRQYGEMFADSIKIFVERKETK